MKQIVLSLLFMVSVVSGFGNSAKSSKKKLTDRDLIKSEKIFYQDTSVKDTIDNMYLLGVEDAELYYEGQPWAFFAGFLFGLIGTLAVVFLSNPRPETSRQTILKSENEAYFSNPMYRLGFKRRGRYKNIIVSLYGAVFASIVILLLGAFRI